MQISKRIDTLEERRIHVMNEMLEAMSDDELAELAGPTHPAVDRWLSTLTDNELETLRKGGPGYSAVLASAPKAFFERREYR